MFKRKLLLIVLSVFVLTAVILGTTKAQAASNPFYESDQIYQDTVENSVEESPASSLKNEDEASESTEDEVAGSKKYVVKFKPGVSLSQIYNLINSYDYEVVGSSENKLFGITTDDIETLKSLLDGYVRYIEEDIEIELSGADVKPKPISQDEVTAPLTPNDPLYSSQWYLEAINATNVWNYNKGKDTTYVAVIDSGIDRTQQDLMNANICNGVDIVLGGSCTSDYSGHGTNVIGIIAASLNNGTGISGISPNISIVPIRVVNADGSATVLDVAEAIYLAVDNGCKVINLSLGGGHASVVEDAIDYAYSSGCIIVAAAGNEGEAMFRYPASYIGVISVGSIDESLTISDFSNYNNSIDVVAPGESIMTTDDYDFTGQNYSRHNGTSFSAPCVSALAALAVSYDEDLSPDEFTNLLRRTSTDLGSQGYDIYYGYGLINADKLLQELYNSDADLNDIKVDSGTLSPAFSPYVTEYDLSLPEDHGSFTITPELINENAAFKVDGQEVTSQTYNLNNGEELNINIEVTAQSGENTKEYIIHVNQSGTPNYSITFNSLGSTVYSATVKSNSTVSLPSAPTRSGYAFGGWYKDSGYKTAWNFSSDVVTSDTILYAKWIPQAQYSISTSVNKSTYGYSYGTGKYYIGSDVTLKAVPKSGYRFVRWVEGTEKVSSSAIYTFTASKNTTLKAEFASISTPSMKSVYSNGYNTLNITWKSVSGATGYEIYRAYSRKGTYKKVGETTETSFTQSSLTTGKYYYYKVKAYCVAGSTKTYSKISSYKYAKPVPTVPSINGARLSSTSIRISGSSVSGATKYEIYRSTTSRGYYRRVAVVSSIDYINTRLSKNKTYYYKVRAYRLVGRTKVYGAFSSPIRVR
ncbi:MAG: S8 family serine peptidase [Eubacteriales bacterium]